MTSYQALLAEANGYFGSIYSTPVPSTPVPSAIEKLRAQRKPKVTSTPPKPKPVTDEQLLAVVEELKQDLEYHRRLIADLQKKTNEHDNRFWSLRYAGPFARLFGSKWYGK